MMARVAHWLRPYVCVVISLLCAAGSTPKTDVGISLLFDRDSVIPEDEWYDDIFVVNVTCNVWSVGGEPSFSIGYIGSRGNDVDLLDQWLWFENHGRYYNGTISQLMRLPAEGHILCRVKDGRSHYETTESIVTEATDCPSSVQVQIYQEIPVIRPNGLLHKSCVLSGIPYNRVKYCWLYLSEADEPICTYSIMSNVTKTTSKDFIKNLVIRHETSEYGLQSLVQAHVKILPLIVFKWQFLLHDNSICADTAPIIFEDPIAVLSVSVVKSYKSSSVIDVICTVAKAAGRPTFQVWYIGRASEKKANISGETHVTTSHLNSHDKVTARVTLSEDARIMCKVVDLIGTYFVEKNFRMKAGSYTSSILTLTLPAAFASVVMLVICCLVYLCCRRHMEGKSKDVSSESQENLLEEMFNLADLPQGGQCVFDEYSSDKWDWTAIKDISAKPKLYIKSGPSIDDVWQASSSQADSWFLGALYCLCIAYKKGNWKQFHKIFSCEGDITENTVVIKLWRFGEWREIEVETTLPTEGGKLRYVKSRKKGVFWSSLLQKAIATEYTNQKEFAGEGDVHVLEDLTGGLVSRQKVSLLRKKSFFNEIKSAVKKGLPVICSKRQEGGLRTYWSVTELAGKISYEDEHFITLQGFAPTENEQWENPNKLTMHAFCNSFDEVHTLTSGMDGIIGYINGQICGRWGAFPPDNGTLDSAWKNPQYLLEINRPLLSYGKYIPIEIFVMQGPLQSSDDFCEAYKRGFEIYLLRPKQPVPKYAYKRGENDLMYLSSAYTHDQTREVRISRTVLVGEKYIIIPCAQEGFFNTMFLLRMVAPRKDILRFRKLPVDPNEDPPTNHHDTVDDTRSSLFQESNC